MLPTITCRETTRERREELRKPAEKVTEAMAENLGFDKSNKPILFISGLFRVRPNKPILFIRILKEIGWISERKRKPFLFLLSLRIDLYGESVRL